MKRNQLLNLLFISGMMLFLFSEQSSFTQQCPDGIISYWQLEETSDTIYQDYAGDNEASTSDAPYNLVDGVVGNAKSFNGSSNYINVPDDNSFDFSSSSSFSVEFWAKFDDAGTPQNLVMIGRDDVSNSFLWWIGAFRTSGFLHFELTDNAGNGLGITGNTDISDGNWHHIVAVYDASANKIVLYRNGNKVGEAATSYSSSFSGSSELNIGYLNLNGSPGYYFNGALDEIAIYETALEETTVDNHYANANSFGMGYCDDGSPRLITVPQNEAIVNQVYTYDVDAVGYPPISYELLSKPDGMNINTTTGEITWTPASISDQGVVSVRAYRGAEADTQNFVIYIADEIVCPTGLKNLWKLDESSGPTYADFKENNTAQGTNPPSANSGILNGAQSFDGSNEALTVDDSDSYNWEKTQSFTISTWINTNSSSTRQVVIGRDGGAGSDLHMWLGIWETGEAVFYLIDAHNNYPGTDGSIKGGTISDGNWHHLVAVRDNSTQKNYLYVDGVLVAESDAFAYSNSFGAVLGTSPLTIGWIDLSNNRNYNGKLDEIAIFEKALSSTEVSDYYNTAIANEEGFCPQGNFSPAILTSPSESETLNILEDEEYTYQFECNDIDEEDVLVISAEKPEWLSFNWNTGEKTAILTGTPTNDDVGTDTVIITVSDETVEVSQKYYLQILNVNDTPEITSSAVTSVPEGTQYSYVFTVTDVDTSDVITIFSETTMPGWLSFTPNSGKLDASGLLEGTPGNDDIGAHPIALAATDGTDTVRQNFNIIVSETNDLPVLMATGPFSIDEDSSIELNLDSLNWSDVDNTAGEISVILADGDNYTLSGLTVIPDNNYFGSITVPTHIEDPYGSSDTLDIVVNVNSVNDEPVIQTTPVNEAIAGELYAYLFEANDEDGTTPVLDDVKKPSWLTFQSATGILTGTPTFDDLGEDTVILRASDDFVDVEQEFVISVISNNNLPVVTSTEITQATEDLGYTYEVIATDQDDDPLTYTATTIPEWLTFNQSTQVLTGTPLNEHEGDHDVVIKISDGKQSINHSFVVTVTKVNDAPEITGISEVISIKNDSLLSIELGMLEVNDEDNDYPQDFSITVLDGNNYSRSSTTITPNSDFTGTLNIPVMVNDGEANSNVFNLQVVVTSSVNIVNSFIEEIITVYPNPVKDELNITIKNRASQPYIMQLFDITGKVYFTHQLFEMKNHLKVDNIPQGLYMMRITDGTHHYIQRLIIHN